MAIFELDEGHAGLVQPMRPNTDAFDVDSSALIDQHVADLLGERVLDVRRGEAGGGGPHLLALDATARPVVVEVVQLLDGEGLLRALRHAGGAARLSRSDLARMYPTGPEAFEADVAVFRDRSPIVQSQPSGQSGVRLVVVCSEVEDGVLDAVEFVTAALHVEVLRLGVTQGPGGRRYVEVSPLRRGQGRSRRRPVEPGPRTGSIAVAPTGRTVRSGALTDPTPVVGRSFAPVPVTSPAPVDGQAATPSDPVPIPTVSTPAPAQEPSPAPVVSPVEEPEGTVAGPTSAVEAVTPPQVLADVPEERSEGHHGSHVSSGAPTTLLPAVVEDGRGTVADAESFELVPLPVLAAFAASGGAGAQLVWVRVRRGQRHVAALRPSGLIELPDASLHADPSAAAVAAADLESSTDGWRVWRLGEDGPTLGEAVGAQA